MFSIVICLVNATQCPLMAKKEIVALAGLVSFLKVGKQVNAPKEKTLI